VKIPLIVKIASSKIVFSSTGNGYIITLEYAKNTVVIQNKEARTR
jgi:NurA-like 5'-3' nuclease